MRMDHETLGPVPSDENCAQVGQDNFSEQSMQECKRYMEMLENKFPAPNDDVFGYFSIKSFPHDFGSYREVVFIYNSDCEDSCDYMLHVEGNLPNTWEE